VADPRRSALVLAVWTAFVWTTRIRNIVGDDALDGGAKAARVLLALSFTVLAAVVGVAAWRRHRRLREAVLALAAWTAAVWAVRSIGIATDHHSAAFVAVHLVLAAVSIALSVLAVRASTRSAQGSPAAAGSR
jgi:hypothetical protein